MMDEPAAPRPVRGGALTELSREDLELFSKGELEDRISALETEIQRARSAMEKKTRGRAAADAVFSFSNPP